MPGLGFNCRANRDRWRAGGIVPVPALYEGVGPGSYEVGGSPSTSGARPGFAPFLSTTERVMDTGLVTEVPGPGYYASEPAILTGGTGRVTDVFKSRSKRFQARSFQNETPGPGAYLGHEEFGLKGGPGKGEEAQKIKWVRVPTAPSIPGREQSYGYEEGHHGELIMQRPVEVGHTGHGNDRPGPVDYQPRVDFTRKSTTMVDFSKGSDRQVTLDKLRASTTPGPGHYNARRCLGEKNDGVEIGNTLRFKRPRPTAAFHSKTARDKPRKKPQPMPGPGDYSLPGAIEAAREPGRKDLSFLSTAERFGAPPGASNISRAPGPGSYAGVPSDFDRWRALSNARRGRITPVVPVGFQSTTLRFGDSSKSESSLGPASYNMLGMAEEMSRRVAAGGSKLGAFGSTSKRFPVGCREDKQPGPGSYDMEVLNKDCSAVDIKSSVGTSSSAVQMGLGRTKKQLPSALSSFAS
ncbi:unnamed protein product, partial [Choristocarpus tenellus]